MVNRAVVVLLLATLARDGLAHVSRPVVGASSRRSPVGPTRRSVATALVRRDRVDGRTTSRSSREDDDDQGGGRRRRRSVLATLVFAWSVAARGSTAAETGGRLGGGGSFSRVADAPTRVAPRARPRDRVRRPPTTTRLGASSSTSPAGTALVVGTFAAVVAYGGASGSNSDSEKKSVEVTRTSIALDVADRDAPDSVLSVLRRLSETASTDTLEGVRTLLSKVSLELLRQKRSIFAAVSRRERFDDFGRAERTFHEWSVRERAKFRRETVSVYDGIDDSVRRNDDDDDHDEDVVQSGKATSVVVTLTTAATTTDGGRRRRHDDVDEDLVVGGVRSIEDVERVLTTLAATSSSSSSPLLSAEILWTPAERTETLARDDVWRDHPDLVTLA